MINQLLSISYMCFTILKEGHAYQSKHNLNCENQIILLMVKDGEKWHYVTVKNYIHCLEK